MKKIISMVLGLMLFSSMTVTAMAGSFQVTTDKDKVCAGDNVTVTIKLDKALEGNYRNIQGQLNYDPDLLSYVSHEMSKDPVSYTAKNMTEREYFTFSYTDFSRTGFAGIPKGTIGKVVFKAAKDVTFDQVKTALTLTMSVQDLQGNIEKTEAETELVICKNHTPGAAATCTKPQTCTVCGITLNGVLKHSFDQKNTDGKYLASKATCTAAAKYYKSCECGEKGTATFTSGKALGHKEVTVKGKAATCTKTGLTDGKKCSVCNTVTVKQQTIKAKGHNYSDTYTVDKAASATKNGSKSRHCTRCDAKTSVKTIYKLATAKLGTTIYTYNGKVKSPKVILKDSKGNTISSKNYTVTKAKGRKNVGKYTYKVTFKNEYKGIKAKTFTFKINPQSTKITSLTKGKKSFTVKWSKKTTQTTGYQIYYSTSKTRTNGKQITISKNTTTTKTISKLKGGKKYYVWVRTYKTVDGKKYYSDWSARKYVTTKK